MSTAETLAIGTVGALALACLAAILDGPSWLAWGLLLAGAGLAIAGLGFALFPPKDP